MEWYVALSRDYAVAPTPQEARALWRQEDSTSAIRAGIEQGHIAMWQEMAVPRASLNGRWPFEVGMVPLPQRVQAATTGVVMGYAIPPNSEHLEAAWTWIKYLTEYGGEFMLPVRRSLMLSSEYGEQAGTEIVMAVDAALKSHVIFARNSPVCQITCSLQTRLNGAEMSISSGSTGAFIYL